jgi:four helix bundle protein
MDKGPVKNYRDLVVWQRAKAFAVDMYRISGTFPHNERYGMTDQIRRAAVSIASNTAEGHIRRSDRAFANHLDIALGSAAELDTQLDIALAVDYLGRGQHDELAGELLEIIKMLCGLSKTVRTGRQKMGGGG